jgi:hypothetical protein
MPTYRIVGAWIPILQHGRDVSVHAGAATSTAGNAGGYYRPSAAALLERTLQSDIFPVEAPVGGNVIVSVDTAGQITWTGSSVTLAYKEAVTAGQITWTGSTTITLVHGVGALTAGAITWTGSAVPLQIGVTVTGGVITWTGSSVVLKYAIPVTAGVITWSGSTSITLAISGGTTVNVDTPGVITWTGSSVVLKLAVGVTAGVITWTGSSVTLAQKQVVTAGVITWTGSSIALAYKITPTAGVITWSGSTAITLVAGGNVVVSVTTPGVITWTGQDVTVLAGGMGAPVKGPTRKTALVGTPTLEPLDVVYIESVLTFDDALVIFDDAWITLDGYIYTMASQASEQLSPDDNDVEELAGAPRAVMIGSGKNTTEGV